MVILTNILASTFTSSYALYGSKYKYILAGIDATSRFKVTGLLRTKQACDVAEMISDIYKVVPLTYFKIFQCSNGSEFKREVTMMLEKHGFKIRRVTTKYKHIHTAFVKALNKILAERLFKVQDAQELNDLVKVSATCVKHLYGLVYDRNDTTTKMIGMKPKDAILLDQVPLVNQEAYPPEDKLPEDGLYQYLLQPSEEHDDQQCRVMDRMWSKGTYRLRKVVEDAGMCMLIPEDIELPPDYVQEW